MKHVLHVPDDWKALWGSAIDAAKADLEFNKHHKEYCERYDRCSSQKRIYHGPLVNTVDAVLGILSRSTFGYIPNAPRYYRVNDPMELLGGVINKFNLSPDLVTPHKEFQPLREEDLRLVNPLHVLEVKPWGGVLCYGTNMPRLVVKGKHSMSSFRVVSGRN